MLRNDLTALPGRPDAYKSKLFFFLFLASLGMFFAGSLVSYLVIRGSNAFNPDAFPASKAVEYLPLSIPFSFWASTVFLILISICLHVSCFMVRRQRIFEFKIWLAAAFLFAMVFLGLQYFGMYDLLETHTSRGDGATKSYGICFTLAFVHALHVIGGVGFLSFVVYGAWNQKFDHERHWTVDNCASYWHFLDVVWIIMLITFLVAR